MSMSIHLQVCVSPYDIPLTDAYTAVGVKLTSLYGEAAAVLALNCFQSLKT